MLESNQEIPQLGWTDPTRSGPASSLEDAILHYMDHPVDWVNDLVGEEPDDWQSSALQDLIEYLRVAVRSGHGVGKTHLEAVIVCFFLDNRPKVKIICVPPTKEQMEDALWAELRDLIAKSPYLTSKLVWTKDRVFAKGDPEGRFAVLRTAEVRKKREMNEIGTVESIQGKHSETVVLIFDEAAGIEPTVFNALQGAQTGDDVYVFMGSQATRTSGPFYDAFHKLRHLWRTYHINSEDCPRVSRRWVKDMLDTYGSREHPVYRIKVRGEFPLAQPNALYPIEWLEWAAKGLLATGNADYFELGVDVARYGSSLTIITVKHGPMIVELLPFRHQSTMETAGRVVHAIQKYKPVFTKVDVSGIGGSVYDRLKELSLPGIIGIDSGEKKNVGPKFLNRRAEIHWNLRELLEREEVCFAPNLARRDVLIAQASPMTYTIDSNGKIRVETKEEMLTRGQRSPDELDSVVMACAPPRFAAHHPGMKRKRPTMFGCLAFMGR